MTLQEWGGRPFHEISDCIILRLQRLFHLLADCLRGVAWRPGAFTVPRFAVAIAFNLRRLGACQCCSPISLAMCSRPGLRRLQAAAWKLSSDVSTAAPVLSFAVKRPAA
jgi:hypothetical protein